MTTVRISVDSEQGDVSVEIGEHVKRFGDDERACISRLLGQAVATVDRAYGLSPKQGVEAPKKPEANS